MLCNTSANYNGKGFFPNVESVMNWGEMDLIWSENKLYVKRNTTIHSKIDILKSALS